MNALGLCLTLIAAGLLFALPRRWAPLPLLIGAMYIPLGQEITIGPFHFTAIRILIAAGVLRVVAKRERIAGPMTRLDWLMILWAAYAVFNTVFHQNPTAVLIYRLGLMLDALGIFLLFRIFVREPEDLRRLFGIICVLLAPIAMGMIAEKLTGRNYFALSFGDMAPPEFRNGGYRARGPFYHAILAGTVGAASLPMALCLWRENRRLALVGLGAASGIVYASGSSGPIMTALTVIFAVALWTQRQYLRAIRWSALVLILALAVAMNAPVYYLIARIDITGGSTGYHRAALIESAVIHLDEWWLAGTDYTRHWMPAGIPGNAAHTDLTNQYLVMGVMGGLPLMLLYIWILFEAFSVVGREVRSSLASGSASDGFLIWTLGAILFGHVTTFLSISYFGQSFVILYLLLAVIGSLQAMWPVYDASSTPEYDEEQPVVTAATAYPALAAKYEGLSHRFSIGFANERTDTHRRNL
jgi:hypothetical protein